MPRHAMMATELTPQQRECVERRGNIAVTAGAGTGKTRVMTERIIGKLGELDDIRELVVLTYTEDAAAELRERVYQSLVDRALAAEAGEGQRLEEMRAGFSDCHIGTMHAFFARLARRFAADLEGVDAAFRVVEGIEQEDLLRTAIEETLDGMAASDGSTYRDDLRRWLRQGRRRSELRVAVGSLIEKRVALGSWLDRHATAPEQDLHSAWRRWAQEYLAEVRGRMLDSPELAALMGRIRAVEPLRDVPDDPMAEPRSEALAAYRNRDFPALLAPLTTPKGKARRFGGTGRAPTWGGDRLGPLRDDMTAAAAWVHGQEAAQLTWDEDVERDVSRVVASVARIARACLDVYADRKGRAGVVDFADLELLAAQLLDVPQVLATLQRQFRAIFVDEFQDTNLCQWGLLRKLACAPGTARLADDGLFIVGDEKQAIYEFRGGEVEVFAHARSELEPLGLQGNFRSGSNLLLFTNRFFECLLVGGEPYEARAQRLRHRAEPAPPSDSAPGQGTVRHLVVPTKGGEDDLDEVVGAELEAQSVATLLREIVDGEREEEYPGIAGKIARRLPTVGVLLRRRAKQHVYESALRSVGVVYSAARGRGFYDRSEIRDLCNALRAIADPAADIALVGLLRSPLVGCSDVALLLLTSGRRRREALWATLERTLELGEMGRFGEDDARALRKAHSLLVEWRRASPTTGIASLLVLMLRETGAYAALSFGPEGEQRVLNAEKLIDVAREFESGPGPTLRGFVRLMDIQAEREPDEGDADMPEGGAIQLLTVHGAKGLEWPMVIVPDTARNFDRSRIEESDARAGSPELGRVAIGTLRGPEGSVPAVSVRFRGADRMDVTPFAWQLLESQKKSRQRAEEKRLLYVAFTRAMDHVVVCSHQEKESDEARPLSLATSWSQWIQAILDDPEATAGSMPFYTREDIAPAARLEPRSPDPSGRPVAFSPQRLWAPSEQARALPVGDETVLLPEAPATPAGDRVGLALSALGHLLLPLAYAQGLGADQLKRRAGRASWGVGDTLDDAAVVSLVDAVLRACSCLRERLGRAERLAWNVGFDEKEDAKRLVGQIDVLALLPDKTWIAVDVDYGASTDAAAYRRAGCIERTRTLGRVASRALGVEKVRAAACLAGPDSAEWINV